MAVENRKSKIQNPHVVVIGAGSTGAATAHDLALRGFRVTVVERGEVASGTTGRNHCLLHSGARYAVIIGDDELSSNAFTVKDLKDGTQQKMSREALVNLGKS